MSRFLTAHQNILGYLVPYSDVEDTVKESRYNARVKSSVTRMDVTIDSGTSSPVGKRKYLLPYTECRYNIHHQQPASFFKRTPTW